MLRLIPLLRSLVAGLVTALLCGPVSAHGGHGHHHGYGYGGHHYGSRVGVHFGRSRYGRHRRHHSRVSFAWSAPLYVAPRHHHAPRVARPAVVESTSRAHRALPDMPDFDYEAREGQDAAQLTLDRRDCERQAWRSTRPDPTAGTVRVHHDVRYVERRHYEDSPLPRAASGALLGAIGGAIGGDAGVGAAIGAAVGAASWLIGGAHAHTVNVSQEVVHREYVPPPGPDAAALRAALMACMEGRGYVVR